FVSFLLSIHNSSVKSCDTFKSSNTTPPSSELFSFFLLGPRPGRNLPLRHAGKRPQLFENRRPCVFFEHKMHHINGLAADYLRGGRYSDFTKAKFLIERQHCPIGGHSVRPQFRKPHVLEGRFERQRRARKRRRDVGTDHPSARFSARAAHVV